jgi:putative intracellular protease/amidase
MRIRKLIITVFVVLFSVFSSNAQGKVPEHVAIFLFNGVELLDFAGPSEVFSVAGFNTYTVSADGKEIRSHNLVKLVPDFSLEAAPPPDIIVFPGGPEGAPLSTVKNQKVMDWLTQRKAAGALFMSVSTATVVFAKAGFLDTKSATTHWQAIDDLKKTYPAVTITANARIVDNGQVITTAGSFAGIDAALHIVFKSKGSDVAIRVARYMEHEKWIPEDGVVAAENDVIKNLRTASIYNHIQPKQFADGVMEDGQLIYEGELLNLATELNDIHAYKRAAFVLDVGTDLFPDSDPMYAMLISAYIKTRKAAPIDEALLMKLIKEGRIEEATMAFEKATKDFPGWKFVRESEFSAVIELTVTHGDYHYAAKVCDLALKAYPASARMNYWMGRVYKFSGMKAEAIASFKKSEKFDPGYSDIVNKEIAELESIQQN